MAACRKFVVSGRVQGVWFRESTRRQAVRLDLKGHAINLPDGSVEVMAFGDLPAISALEAWLAKGPRLARVDSVTAQDLDAEVPQAFTTA